MQVNYQLNKGNNLIIFDVSHSEDRRYSKSMNEYQWEEKVDMHKNEYLDCLTTSLKATITMSVIDTHNERDTSNIDIPGEELNTYS